MKLKAPPPVKNGTRNMTVEAPDRISTFRLHPVARWLAYLVSAAVVFGIVALYAYAAWVYPEQLGDMASEWWLNIVPLLLCVLFIAIPLNARKTRLEIRGERFRMIDILKTKEQAIQDFKFYSRWRMSGFVIRYLIFNSATGKTVSIPRFLERSSEVVAWLDHSFQETVLPAKLRLRT